MTDLEKVLKRALDYLNEADLQIIILANCLWDRIPDHLTKFKFALWTDQHRFTELVITLFAKRKSPHYSLPYIISQQPKSLAIHGFTSIEDGLAKLAGLEAIWGNFLVLKVESGENADSKSVSGLPEIQISLRLPV